MLSKQYLRYRRSGDYLKILFKKLNDDSALEIAGMVLELFRAALNGSWRRCDLEDAVRNALSGSTDIKFGQALSSLLFKRVDWIGGAGCDGLDLSAFRTELFKRSGELLRSGRYQNATDYRRALPVPDGVDIYGDLAENDTVGGFKDMDEKSLINLYNISQVQGVLMRSRELEITLRQPDTAKLRNLYKYLKFCRLLADIKSGSSGSIVLKVSGPLSLLSDNRKYGLQLALFFPAVVTFAEWRLRCDIELDNGVHPYRLVLDEKSGLVSSYRHYSTYIPEEIELFRRHFAENCTDYTIESGGNALKLKGGGIVVPDFTFIRVSDGTEYYLELFHRYHASSLAERMNAIEKGLLTDGDRLIIGIDRALARPGSEAADFAERNSERAFLFRDFPGVAKVLKQLRCLGGKCV